jgi:RNA polymerase sigma-70 factor, ECF subfamily
MLALESPSLRMQPGVPFGLQATTARTGQMQMGHLGTPSGSEARPVLADRDSFEAFFVDHHADLFGALYLITRNRHEAEEIMQDAFLKVLERWDRVSSLEDSVGYLYRTAMNLLRKRWRRASVMLRRTVGLSDRDDEMSVIETRVDVARALAWLSPRQRAVVVLTELLEFNSEEVGRMLGIAPGTVRMHASRGRAALADLLGGPR